MELLGPCPKLHLPHSRDVTSELASVWALRKYASRDKHPSDTENDKRRLRVCPTGSRTTTSQAPTTSFKVF